jgi:hypothetical protein
MCGLCGGGGGCERRGAEQCTALRHLCPCAIIVIAVVIHQYLATIYPLILLLLLLLLFLSILLLILLIIIIHIVLILRIWDLSIQPIILFFNLNSRPIQIHPRLDFLPSPKQLKSFHGNIKRFLFGVCPGSSDKRSAFE